MHRTRVSPNKGYSAMLFGTQIQNGCQNAQRTGKLCHKLFSAALQRYVISSFRINGLWCNDDSGTLIRKSRIR